MLAVNITLPYWYWRRESNPKNHGSQPGYLPLANASICQKNKPYF